MKLHTITTNKERAEAAEIALIHFLPNDVYFDRAEKIRDLVTDLAHNLRLLGFNPHNEIATALDMYEQEIAEDADE